MVWWKQYALSVFGCVMICGILIQIVSDSHYQKLLRLICGVLMAVTVLNGISKVNVPDLIDFDGTQFSPEEFVDAGKETALREQKACIRKAFESYISTKAKDLGMEVSAEITLNDELIPVHVMLLGESDPQRQPELELVLEQDLGITKENQVWNWNQEKSSS